MSRLRYRIIFCGIFLLAAALRLYQVNWDQNYHMHPDERAIVLTVLKLSFPTSPQAFFSASSSWNPKFFAYGSLPFYLLSVLGTQLAIFNQLWATYDGFTILGRYLSAFFDLGTLVFIFLLTKRLLTARYALIASFFYAISVLPIQLSHFYAVDTPLTFFTTGTLYFLIRYYERLTVRSVIAIGIFFGSALATKISAALLMVSIGSALAADYFLLFLRQPHKPEHYLPHLPLFLSRFLIHLLLIIAISTVIFLIFEPYALIDLKTFLSQTIEQSHMTKSAFTFPYTLQYVNKVPYLYESKNIVLFGQGPILSFFTFAGILMLSLHAMVKKKHGAWAKEFILVIYFWTYVIIVGSFAIGFMRYMLPVYPILCIAGAFFISQGASYFPRLSKPPVSYVLGVVVIFVLLLWPLSFLHIYRTTNTRIQATNWITASIPQGSTLAIEHWDDALPLYDQAKYTTLTLPLYDQDTPEKWAAIREQLKQTDYIILASNRLYTPLMKLTQCNKLPVGRCYTETARYYQQLFDGTLGFSKIADITSYPTLPFTSYEINDQGADESFTVYDHPRILIFKKTAN